MADQRIKLARRKAGLSLRNLADKMEGLVSAQAIGKYERGEMAPGSDVLIALSKALGVSIPYLMSAQGVELGECEFRTKASTSAKERSRVETEVLEWVERYLQIEAILDLPSGSWACPNGMPRRIDSLEAAERLADELRVAWNLGTDPIPNMTELLEERGIKVLLADLPERVSGLTCFVKRVNVGIETPVIVANSSKTLERRRFTMAHELGHRVIDPASEGDIEKLCHRFAGSFLVNREHLQKEIGEHRSAFGVREIVGLKRLYRISAAAFLMRLEQIGVIDHGAIEYAFRSFASGWRSEEPEPLEGPSNRAKFEAPRRFERLVYRAAAEDMISLPKAVELLRVPLAEVEKGLKGPLESHADHRQR
jgi:Zn-dependent peptidase ImmA (M78 family)/DNA-binding XRE family transcriptional regulator